MMAAGVFSSFAGCGNGNFATVEGNVTVGGKPADDGAITFNSADGQGPSAGTAIKNGKYQMDGGNGLPPGAKNVAITVTLKTGRQVKSGAMGAPPGAMLDERESFSSKETCKIAAGQINRVDFDLKPMHEKK